MPFYHHNDLTSIPTTQPAWLQRVAPEARVHQARMPFGPPASSNKLIRTLLHSLMSTANRSLV